MPLHYDQATEALGANPGNCEVEGSSLVGAVMVLDLPAPWFEEAVFLAGWGIAGCVTPKRTAPIKKGYF